MAEAASRRRFVTVLVIGVVSAALTAVAAGKAWVRADVDHRLLPGVRDPDRTADMPLALALSLVVLAGWGALLVTRGRVRRFVAGLGVAAALGVVACVVAAPFTLPDQVRSQLPDGSGDVHVSVTGWFVVSALGALVGVGALAVAWWQCPSWPTMSTRYDAPAARAAEDDTDLWRALDRGHDPTDGPVPPSP